MIIVEDPKTVDFSSTKGESIETNLNVLSAAIKGAVLDIDLIHASEK